MSRDPYDPMEHLIEVLDERLKGIADGLRELASAVRDDRRPVDLYGPRGTEIRRPEET